MSERPPKQELPTRYLLGDVTEEEQSAIERQLFADDELFGRLLEADADLVDSYARGELTAAERSAFEERLAASPRVRERVEFARALSQMRPRALRPRFLRAFGIAAMVVLAVGGAWLALESTRLRRERGELLSERQTVREQVSRLERAAGEQQARLGELSRELERLREQERLPGVRIVSFVLAAGLTRDGSVSNRLVVPRKAEVLVLELPLETAEYRSYRVTIGTLSGREVATLRGLPPTAKRASSVELSLSASLLPPGDYVLTLSGEKGAAAEPVAEYAFRVAR